MLSLREKYGEVIIKKDSILYHVSDEKYKFRNDKLMFFCTIHPSEFTGYDAKYIHFVKLKKDISLLFMVGLIKNPIIISGLNNIIKNNSGNLLKNKDYDVLLNMKNKLENENFDGWFTSIENSATVEVCLINNNNIFEVIKTNKLKENWNNVLSKNGNNIIKKKWGKNYPICSIERPFTFNINKNQYKKSIDNYMKYKKSSSYVLCYVFQVILENALINYF